MIDEVCDCSGSAWALCMLPESGSHTTNSTQGTDPRITCFSEGMGIVLKALGLPQM